MNKNLKQKIISLRLEGKTYNDISSILNCSKGTVSFHCSKLKENNLIVQTNVDNNIRFNFDHWSANIKHNIKILYDYGVQMTEISDVFNININEVKIFCKKIIKPSYQELNNYQQVKRRRKKIKVLGVLYKGGKCQTCGYNKYFENLEFHHLDPSKKEFSISQKCNHRWATIKKELDKCICLCSTCHRELHAELNNNIKILPTDFK